MRTGFFVFLLALSFHGAAWAQPLETAPAPGGGAPIPGSTETRPPGDWRGMDPNSGINLLSARRTQEGLVVRVKRLIKPGADAAKEFARGIPLLSTAANWATLGLYNRALKSDGADVRTTWLNLNCQNKTFNVTGDGYSWQNIYNDKYGQAEDLYYRFCTLAEGQTKPLYLSLPAADSDMLRSAQMKK